MRPEKSPTPTAPPSRSLRESLLHALMPNRADHLAKASRKIGRIPTLEQVIASSEVVAASASCADVTQPLSTTEQQDLLRMLHTPAYRWAAAYTLRGRGDEATVSTLQNLANHADSGMACAALYALSFSKHPEAVKTCANVIEQAVQLVKTPAPKDPQNTLLKCEFLLRHWQGAFTDSRRADLVTLAASGTSTPLKAAAEVVLNRAPSGEVAKETALAVGQVVLACSGDKAQEKAAIEARCEYLISRWPPPPTNEVVEGTVTIATKATSETLKQRAADILAKLSGNNDLDALARTVPGSYFPGKCEPELVRMVLADLPPVIRDREIRRLLESSELLELPQADIDLKQLSRRLFSNASAKGIADLVRIAEEHPSTPLGAVLEERFWVIVVENGVAAGRLRASIEPRVHEPSKNDTERARLECYVHMPKEIEALGDDARAVWRAVCMRDKADFYEPGILRHFIPMPSVQAGQSGLDGLRSCGFRVHENSPWLPSLVNVSYPEHWSVSCFEYDTPVRKSGIIADEIGISRYMVTAAEDNTPYTYCVDNYPNYPRPPLTSFEQLPAGTRKLENPADFITSFDRLHVAVRSLDGKTSEYAEVFPQEDGTLLFRYTPWTSFTLRPEWLPSPRFCARTLSNAELVGREHQPMGAAEPCGADSASEQIHEHVHGTSLRHRLEAIFGYSLPDEQVKAILARFELEPVQAIILWAQSYAAQRSRSRQGSQQHDQILANLHGHEHTIDMEIEM